MLDDAPILVEDGLGDASACDDVNARIGIEVFRWETDQIEYATAVRRPGTRSVVAIVGGQLAGITAHDVNHHQLIDDVGHNADCIKARYRPGQSVGLGAIGGYRGLGHGISDGGAVWRPHQRPLAGGLVVGELPACSCGHSVAVELCWLLLL